MAANLKSDISNLRSSALFRDVFDGLRSEPARMGLSFFALSIGILSLALLLAVLGGLRERSRLLIREVGANVIAALPALDTRRPGAGLTDQQANLLAQNLPGCMVAAVRRDEVVVQGLDKAVTVFAADDTLAAVRGWTVTQGRFLDRWDVTHGERNAVVSRALCDQLRVSVGGVVELGNQPFTVVGVLDLRGGGVEGEVVDSRLLAGPQAVFVPRTAPAPWITGAPQLVRRVDAVFIQVPGVQGVGRFLPAAQRLLRGGPQRAEGISWITPDTLIRGVRRLQRTVQVAGGSITFLCLVLGGTTLMSLMVVNVRDRVSEIGLRRALGATRADIALLFVLEACLVTCAAGVAGTLSAQFLLAIVRHRFDMTLSAGGAALVVPLMAAVAVGATFAYWPARQAALISPSEALRND